FNHNQMQQTKTTIIFLLSVLAISIMTGCSDDDEIADPKEENEEPELIEINRFIEENMSIYYFWNEEMPDIAPEDEEDPEEYFYNLLYSEDRWSFITDNYEELNKYFSGIEKSPGYSLMPIYLSREDNQVVAFIEYVHENTPAREKGLKRGDMIYRVDGETMNDENFSELLNRDNLEITLGEFNEDGSITEQSEISLESEEIDLNPIIARNVIDTLGHKIGYLAYSSFISDYDEELENVLAEFKAEGVTDLVLDLRYNGGGAISSARKLGDMLVPEGNEGQLFITEEYNDILTEAFEKQDDMSPDSLIFQENENNLNLEKYYVLTTSSTASASEMMIYGLEPYMDVEQIGETTHGKYYGSATFSEEDKHNWAIQPIIMRLINVDDDLDYSKGLSPDHELDDLFYYFPYPLGDPEELFMAKAISVITDEPFIYEEDMQELKSAGRLKTPATDLRNKLYPGRSRMWTTPPDIPISE
ncbi:MAG: S41 family peptidase, partial [Marinilabilia sp.]